VAARLAASIGALRDAKCPGSAVLVSLAAARIGRPNHETVAAAKAGVEGSVHSAAATRAGNGIRSNIVAPRIMDMPATTAILGSAMGREAAARQYPLPALARRTHCFVWRVVPVLPAWSTFLFSPMLASTE